MKKLNYFAKNRSATWLELFFDLIFVVVIGRITHLMAHTHHGHIELTTLMKFPLIFIPVWWLWTNHTIYSNLYDTDSKAHRFVTLVIMFLMVVLSLFITTDFDRTSFGFIIVYTAIRLLIASLYLSSTRKHHNDNAHVKMLGTVYFAGALIGLSGALFTGPVRYALYYSSLAVDILLPLFLGRKMQSIPVHSEHLVERSGLLTIILLGESVISLAATLNNISWTAPVIISAISGFILLAGVWWILFDFIYMLMENEEIKRPYLIILPNLLLYMSLVLIANLIRHAILADLDLHTYKMIAFAGMLLFFLGKQISYYILFPRIRKYILTNTLGCFVLSALSLQLPTRESILIAFVLILFAYIASTFRYMVDEEVAERHLDHDSLTYRLVQARKRRKY